jgi:hypothetical protein
LGDSIKHAIAQVNHRGIIVMVTLLAAGSHLGLTCGLMKRLKTRTEPVDSKPARCCGMDDYYFRTIPVVDFNFLISASVFFTATPLSGA